jgi:O-antigen/teichoic acid export membrane protein
MSDLRRVGGNAASILTSDVVNRATSFVMYALVARFLGAFEFGQMSLALSLFYTFQVLAVAGLKTLITREVAKDRSETDQYLVNGSILAVASSILSMLLMYLFIYLVNYTPYTASIILLLSLGLLPYSLSQICESVFQAWEKMHYIAYANVPVNVIKVGLAFLILLQGYAIYHIVIMIVICQVIIMAINWGLMLQYIIKPRTRFDPHFSMRMARSATIFLGIEGTNAVKSSLAVVLLSKLASEIEVGLYSAASQLMVPLSLIFNNVVASIFPIMCRKFESSVEGLQRIAEHLIELLIIIALPVVVGLFVLADPVLLLLYGDKEFLLVSSVLRIVIWIPLLNALTTVLGQVLWASRREKTALRIAVINTLLKLVTGLILINQFGLIGAAVASLLEPTINFLQHYMPVSRMFSDLALIRLVWKPVVATLCMTIYLILVKDQGIFLAVVPAGLLYGGILLAVLIWSAGGPHQFKTRYLYLWSQ